MGTTYSQDIEHLATNKETKIFYNSCDAHALIVLKNLVKNASSYVKAICGNMCSEVSNDSEYLDILEKFLLEDPTRKFQILFDDFDSNFKLMPIAKVLSKFPNQVEIKSLKEKNILYDGSPVHFTVSDDRAFRLETNIEKKMAWGNFNDETKSKVFSSAFDRFFTDEYSKKIQLTSFSC